MTVSFATSPGLDATRQEHPEIAARAPQAERLWGWPVEDAAFRIGNLGDVVGRSLVAVGLRWVPYPFILLQRAFSTQAAYVIGHAVTSVGVLRIWPTTMSRSGETSRRSGRPPDCPRGRIGPPVPAGAPT
jgi:hypothetical protein